MKNLKANQTKDALLLRDRNPCTFYKNAEIIDNSDKRAFVLKARKINLDLGF